MRLRLGLLQDTAAIDRATAKEAAAAQAKRHKHEGPTVKTEAETKAEEKAIEKATNDKVDSVPKPKVRIRPLSEAKAVETGATFISETFLFAVAAGLIFFESWRSRRKETSRREDVAERLNDLEESENAARRALIELEREVLELRAKHNETGPRPSIRRILPKEVWQGKEVDPQRDDEQTKSWLSRIAQYISTKDAEPEKPGPAEQILKQSEAVLAEKHRQALEEAARAAQESSTAQKSTQ